MLLPYALSIALHLYLGARLVPALPAPWSAAFSLLLVVSALSVPLGLFARRLARPPLADKLAWLGLLCMGLFSSLLVLTFARDVVLLAAFTFSTAGEAFVRRSALAVVGMALLLTAVGYLNARRTARVVRVHVPIDGLAPALQDLRIVQISDIHVGPTIKQHYLQAIVDAVNRLEPDIVAITGDLVDGTVAELAAHVAPLAQLRSRHGSFFVTGNHEYYSGADPWVRELRRLGIRVLMNEHEVIGHGGAQLVLAGVPDFSAGGFDASQASDPAAAARGAPADALKILLAHQPRSAAAAAPAGFDQQR
jgi:hypothetical protein